MNVYQSRWGYHPCDYETYLLLKKLNGFYEQALRAFAAWQRWARKEPQNRVRRRHVRNDKGQKIRTEAIGPLPEPRLPALFCIKARIVRHDARHGPKEGWRLSLNHSLAVAEVYRKARKPAATPEAVTPLPWSPEEVRRLVEQASEWL
jgi:hypothetical protein